MTDPMADLHNRGRENFAALVEGGAQRLDALFATVPALGELAVGTVYGTCTNVPPSTAGRARRSPSPRSSQRGW